MSAERIHHLRVHMIVIYGLQPSVVDKGQTVRWPASNMPPSISNTADIVASKLSHLHGGEKKNRKMNQHLSRSARLRANLLNPDKCEFKCQEL